MSERERPPIEDVERGGKEGDPWNTDIVLRLRTFAKTINSKFVTNGRYFFTEEDQVSDQDLQYFAMTDAIEVIEHYRQKLAETQSQLKEWEEDEGLEMRTLTRTCEEMYRKLTEAQEKNKRMTIALEVCRDPYYSSEDHIADDCELAGGPCPACRRQIDEAQWIAAWGLFGEDAECPPEIKSLIDAWMRGEDGSADEEEPPDDLDDMLPEKANWAAMSFASSNAKFAAITEHLSENKAESRPKCFECKAVGPVEPYHPDKSDSQTWWLVCEACAVKHRAEEDRERRRNE